MNWMDAIFFGLVLIAGFIGFRKGLVRIMVITAAYLSGIAAAITLAPQAAEFTARWIKISPVLARAAAMVLVFLLVSLLVRGIGLLLEKITRAALPGFDKTAGLLLGLVLAGILITLTAVFTCTAEDSSALRSLHEGSAASRFLMRRLERFLPEDTRAPGQGSSRDGTFLPHL